MYCVIQVIQKEKNKENGCLKELKPEYTQIPIDGKEESRCRHHYSEEDFGRNIAKAYRISIHENYRENGNVKKKQFVICTVDYYDLVAGSFSLHNCAKTRIENTARELNCSEEVLYILIEEKLQHLQARILEEFQNASAGTRNAKGKS